MRTNLTISVPVWLDKIVSWPVIRYRRCRYGLAFRRIGLGQGIYTIVDPDVFYLVNKYHWTARENHGCIYAVRFAKDGEKGSKIVLMHREIMKPAEGFVIDHKNNNSLDNTTANLRPARHWQNLCNRRKSKAKTSSRFTGVSFNTRRERYDVYIGYGGKVKWVGSFDNEIDAAKAYDAAAKKYHGEYAHLNFPDESSLHRLPLHIFIPNQPT